MLGGDCTPIPGRLQDGDDILVVPARGVAEEADRLPGVILHRLADTQDLVDEEGIRPAAQVDVIASVALHLHPGVSHLRHHRPGQVVGALVVSGRRQDEEAAGEAIPLQQRKDDGVGIPVAVVEGENDGPGGQRPPLGQVEIQVGQGDGVISSIAQELQLGLEGLRTDGEIAAQVVGIGRKLADVVVHQDGHLDLVGRRPEGGGGLGGRRHRLHQPGARGRHGGGGGCVPFSRRRRASWRAHRRGRIGWGKRPRHHLRKGGHSQEGDEQEHQHETGAGER